MPTFAQESARLNPTTTALPGYRLEVSLDSHRAKIQGRQVLNWRNPFSQPIYALGLRGVFADSGRKVDTSTYETFQKRNGSRTQTILVIDSVMAPNNTVVTAFSATASIASYADSTASITWLNLQQPVMPNQVLQLQVDFHTESGVGRKGRQNGGSYFAVDWYPKIFAVSHVHLSADKSRKIQLSAPGLADYEVYITTSARQMVAASGTLLATEEKDSAKIFHFSATKIHAFTWIADSNFVEVAGKVGSTDIRLFLQRSHEKFKHRYLDAVQKALEYLEARYGNILYGQLSIVDSENGASMNPMASEPTLIFVPAGDTFFTENTKFLERRVFYGCAAQYWNGMVSPYSDNNCWLLTGLTAYTGMKMMDIYYGKSANLVDYMGLRLNDSDFNRLIYLQYVRPKRGFYSALFPADFNVDQYKVQAKAALFWVSVAYHFGPEAFENILQMYLQRWKFKHPVVQDFIHLSERFSGKNGAVLFEQVLNEDNVLDYEIESFSSVPRTTRAPREAQFKKDTTKLSEHSESASLDKRRAGEWFETTVAVTRNGTFEFPVVIEVQCKDGSKERAYWDGRDRKHRFTINSRSEAISATIDPDRKILLDFDLANNSKTTKSQLGDDKLASRWLFWLQNLMLLFTSFTG